MWSLGLLPHWRDRWVLTKVGVQQTHLSLVHHVFLATVPQMVENTMQNMHFRQGHSTQATRWWGARDRRSGQCQKIFARTIAKAEAATVPFQHALSTNAGCECVTHITSVQK